MRTANKVTLGALTNRKSREDIPLDLKANGTTTINLKNVGLQSMMNVRSSMDMKANILIKDLP